MTALVVPCIQMSFAQEVTDTTVTDTTVTVTTNSDSPKPDLPRDEAGDELSIQTFKDLVKASKLKEATKVLEALIVEAPNDESLQRERRTLAIRYTSKQKYSEAFEQLQRLIAYREGTLKTARHASDLALYTQQLLSVARRAGKAEEADRAVDRAIEHCESVAKKYPEPLLLPITELLSRKILQMADGPDADEASADEARALGEKHLARLIEFNESDQAGDGSLKAQARILFTLVRAVSGPDSEMYGKQLDVFMDAALAANSDSPQIQMEYANVKYMRIATTYRDNPLGAQEMITAVKATLEPIAKENSGVNFYLSRISSLEPRIESALKMLEMVGQPAPPIEADAWVNADGISEESLQGKVVLYDFWAIWCGPCVATFPHLRQWREEFGDQGFEVVGITRYYNYAWDEETGAATRSKESVEPEVEHVAVQKFLQSHDLGHPCVITPKGDNQTQQAYGVTGIPHAVLIDREGKIQMIKVGSGGKNAEELHAKIRELVEG